GKVSYTGSYRLALVRISTSPESIGAILAPGPIVGESGGPPGGLDRFTISGSPGQEVAGFVAPLPKVPGNPVSVWAALFTGFVFRGEAIPGDSLGVLGTPRLKLEVGTTYTLDVRSSAPTLPSFQYQLWVYPVNRLPETVSSLLRIGDVVTAETLF